MRALLCNLKYLLKLLSNIVDELFKKAKQFFVDSNGGK